MATADEVVVKLTAQTAEYDRRITASENNFVNSVARMSAQAMGLETQAGQSFKQLAVEAEIAGRKIGEALGGRSSRSLRNDDIQDYGRQLDAMRAKYNPLFAASKQYEASLAEINRAHSLGAISAQEQTAAITRLNAAYTSSAKAVTTVGTNSRMAQQQARNLAFQFQDIGTMLAAGQSPFMLLAQQLPQVTMYGGQMTGVMGALKSTFAGLLSPLGLATTGFVLLASVAIPYLTDLVNSGKVSNEELEKQAQRVQAIADKWGIALPALKAYADERERLKTIEGVDEATGLEIKKRFEPARKELDLLRVAFDNVSGAIGLASLEANGAFGAMNNLEKAVKSNKATVDDVDAAIAVLTTSYSQSFDPAIKAIITSLEAFRETVATASGEVATLTGQAEGAKTFISAMKGLDVAINSISSERAQKEIKSLSEKAIEGEISAEDLRRALDELSLTSPDLSQHISEFLRLIGVIRQAKQEAEGFSPIGGTNVIAGGKGGRISNLPGTMNAPSFKPNDIQLDNEAFAREQAAAKKGQGARDKAIREAEREAEAIAKLIDQLEFELEMIGKTDREKLIETNVRRLAASATGEQAERVRELTGAIYDQKEAQDRANDAAKEFNDLAKSALSSFINDIKNGVSAADALANALSKVGDKLLDMALDGLFSDKKGSGGIGGFLASLISGFRANGGPVSSGGAYVVGERGPELFMPGQAGSIIPNIPSMTGGGQSGSVVVNFNPVIDNRGASVEAVARNEMQIEKLKRDLPAIVTQSVRKAQKSNVKLN